MSLEIFLWIWWPASIIFIVFLLIVMHRVGFSAGVITGRSEAEVKSTQDDLKKEMKKINRENVKKEWKE